MMIGNCYQDIRKYEEAIVSYKKLYHQFPSNVLCKDAMYQHIVCLKKLRNKYPISNQIQNRLLTTTTLFLSKFSNSEEIKDIINLRNKIYESQAKNIFEQGQFYERSTGNDYAAILSYKNMIESFPLSQLVSNAQSRIKYLEGKKSKTSTIINSEF